MNTITRIEEALADLADEVTHAERLVEEQAVRIEVLEAEVALLHIVFGSTPSSPPPGG
jgi:t-SNARE complex subunit (syntaxin)